MLKEIPVLSWFDKSTIRHLRLPFSFFLLPVFLFALSQADSVKWQSAITGFIILHLLVFPSTNGYNSHQDRDEGSIGGLRNPPRVSDNLFYATLLLDIVALLGGLYISPGFSLLLLLFITMSRLYSFRGIRLKKYPVLAFAVVFIFQGGFVYLMSHEAISPGSIAHFFNKEHIVCMMVSSLFIGSMYPLTQIYQHEADRKDGVTSLSYLLGYRGTFIFSGALFGAASVLLFFYLAGNSQAVLIPLFMVLISPVIIRLSKWFRLVLKDRANANFDNTMAINRISAVCMNLYFILVIVINHTMLS